MTTQKVDIVVAFNEEVVANGVDERSFDGFQSVLVDATEGHDPLHSKLLTTLFDVVRQLFRTGFADKH